MVSKPVDLWGLIPEVDPMVTVDRLRAEGKKNQGEESWWFESGSHGVQANSELTYKWPRITLSLSFRLYTSTKVGSTGTEHHMVTNIYYTRYSGAHLFPELE